MTDAPALVRAVAIRKRFPVGRTLLGTPRRWIHAVEDVSFEIPRGTTLGLVGESGCGKSTVGRILLGLLKPTSGDVLFDGTEVTRLGVGEMRALRRRIQMIFQDPYGALNPRLTIGDAIGESFEIHQPGLSASDRTAKVAALLERVGLRRDHASRYPAEFSGGQRQRVVIARALAVEPAFVFADEPVSALDVSVQAQIVNLLADLQEERGLTYLFVSHDLKVVEHVSTEVAVMYLGRIVERGPTRAIYATPRHPYTEALLSAIPSPVAGGRARPRILLDGDVPSPMNPPTGCAFHPRCPLRKKLDAAQQARCSSEAPSLVTIGEGHASACHFSDRVG